MRTKLCLGILAALCLGVAGAHATAYTLQVDPNLPPGTTPYVFGAVNPGTPADPVSEAAYINGILPLALGGQTTITLGGNTDTLYRSLNSFSGLPSSVTSVGALTGSSTTITLTSGFAFLSAKYDGQNAGTEIWYIGGLQAGDTITIPMDAFPTVGQPNGYGLSGWTLLGPGTPSVPDGGLTLAMLGSALTCLGLLRKKLS